MANFTQKAIKESFLKLLSEKPISKISVKDIVEDCGINRNSFYYHFSDIPSLMEEIVMDEAETLIQTYPNIDSIEQALEVATSFVIKNKKAVQHIYNSVNRDIYEQYLMKVCEHTVKSYLQTAFHEYEVSSEDEEIAVRYIKCTCFGLIIDWMNSGLDEELPKDTARICELCKGIPEEIIKRSKEA